ncbi:fumarylacetoacetate hydrolase family protein [Paenibacillus chondroitinus]|uniref:Fumarylacetoacetate hydrolase family protein n=1 Tax=Paenibacillus chondroitinus TaxID=59842 RepID=A0ABU6DAJ0_9BACL|nr:MULTISPECIES: fumarylacetoacetate hydrolase family protein [Paenibacillus]MCY9661855.1 fumarylacetoacetate hydrolase family protein [Paenibacillus anseongense]MEB4793941.1 fumarylacetoacetate hydrolase family protein [Paenibacillus chondroitinus]
MRIIRYVKEGSTQLAAVNDQEQIFTLPQGDFLALIHEADALGTTPLALVLKTIEGSEALADQIEQLQLLVPIEAPEVWAAGVTYERSRDARNYEATEGRLDASTFYDKVYDAVRPEIFFKSTAARTVGPGGEVQLRSDSVWQVPEPELGLVLNAKGNIVGYTIGNDMSCRDIEGENPLYLPQAKVWKRSCSLGPAIRLAETVEDPYNLQITSLIYRDGEKAVEGTASTGQLKRKLEELTEYLIRDNELFEGTVLLTGTCIVPPNEFTLAHGDRIEIEISGIGTLVNHVVSAGR